MDSLEIFRDVNFGWYEHAKGVWEDHLISDSKFHRQLCHDITADFEEMVASAEPVSPLGRVVHGGDSPSKVHFLSDIRRSVNKVSGSFVLVDLTGVNHFWEAVLLGMLGSLKQPCGNDSDQMGEVLDNLIHLLGMDREPASRVTPKNILKRLKKRYPWEVARYHDIALAFLLSSAGNENDQDVGEAWLQGMSIGGDEKKLYGFRSCFGKPRDVIEGLSWIMSLRAPVLLALNELDVIAGEVGALAPGNIGAKAEKVRDIFRNTAEGILSLRENTFRTMIVVTCLPGSWVRVEHSSERDPGERFRTPITLSPMVKDYGIERVVGARVSQEYDMNGLRPPFPLWPARSRGGSRHHSMMLWDVLAPSGDHPRQCGPSGMVVEDEEDEDVSVAEEAQDLGPMEKLSARFASLKKRARVRGLMVGSRERNPLCRLFQSAVRYLIMENSLADHLEVAVEINLSGDLRYRSLDVRLRLKDRKNGGREKHFCVRSIRDTGAWALKARLKSAIMESGIDPELDFRHLLVLGRGPLSGNPEEDQRFQELYEAGGALGLVTGQDTRTLWALQVLEREELPGFDTWLAAEKHVSSMRYFALPLSWIRDEK